MKLRLYWSLTDESIRKNLAQQLMDDDAVVTNTWYYPRRKSDVTFSRDLSPALQLKWESCEKHSLMCQGDRVRLTIQDSKLALLNSYGNEFDAEPTETDLLALAVKLAAEGKPEPLQGLRLCGYVL